MPTTSFCPNCFAEGFGERCGQCGYIALSSAGSAMLLPPGTVLSGRYLLGRTLGAGGFGITYLARDSRDGTLVAIKEYLPAMLAVRDPDSYTVYPSSQDNRDTFTHGLSVFNKESEVLRHFAGNQSIVQVLECFEANGTAYFVMEYLDGVNLKGLTRSMGDRLPVGYAMEILQSIAVTLAAVHAQGLLHRDISPENIFVTKEGAVKLIDFGATRFFVSERSRSLSVILKPGFAPPEQYSSKGNQGPWTDIYALCATVYNLLTGRPLPDAPERLGGARVEPLAALVPDVPPAISAAVQRGLELDYRKRAQSMDEFLMDMQASPSAPPQKSSVAKVEGTPFIQMTAGGAAGDKWVIPKNMQMSIGRSSEQCNIVLDEPNISRVHCTVMYDDKSGCFYLTDQSSNGTLVEAGRMERGKTYTLRPGEQFYILTRACAMKVGLE